MNNTLRLLLAILLLAVAVPVIAWQSSAAQGNAPQSQEKDEKFRRSGKPVRDHYIVVLKPETPSEEVEAVTNELLAKHGGTTRYIYTHAIKGFSIELPEAAAIALSRDPKVEYVEEDAEAKAETSEPTNNWNLDRIDQQFGRNGLYYFPNNETGAGVNAYILDSGIKLSHMQFRNADGSGNRATLDADLVWWDGQNGNDCTGHGTAVASVLGGRNFGVAKGVRLHGVRIFSCSDWTATSTIIAGVDWVTQHANKPAVANMSLDVPGWLNGSALDEAIRASIFTGVTYVVAAGNESGDVKDVTPARIPEVITVAATDINDTKTTTSNFGPGVDLFAPGENIMVAGIDDSNHNGIPDDFGFADGTSLAAPEVAGAVARFLGVFPNASPAAVQGAVVKSATGPVNDPGEGSPERLLYADVRHAFLAQQFVPFISEGSTGTDTGLDLGQDKWFAMTGAGEIWSGVPLSNTNGPQGWFAEADAGFPIPGAHPYSLIGTLGTKNFYIGVSNFRMQDSLSTRLFLRTNDDHAGDGSGFFTCQVELWKILPQARGDLVSQNVPNTLLPGQNAVVSVTMLNRGPQLWKAWQNFRLASEGDSLIWGVNRVPVLTDVWPGQQYTFNFSITAPSVPGNYNFQWRMLDEGVQRFGDLTSVPITVLAPSNQAEFVSQSVTRTMYASEQYTATVTMKNVGNTTWAANSVYGLGSQNLQDNLTWGLNRVRLPVSVPPGGTYTFTFTVTAPLKAGTYNFQWRMVQDGVEWFGPQTPNLSITVRTPCNTC
jgi:subtilisin family serine protease